MAMDTGEGRTLTVSPSPRWRFDGEPSPNSKTGLGGSAWRTAWPRPGPWQPVVAQALSPSKPTTLSSNRAGSCRRPGAERYSSHHRLRRARFVSSGLRSDRLRISPSGSARRQDRHRHMSLTRIRLEAIVAEPAIRPRFGNEPLSISRSLPEPPARLGLRHRRQPAGGSLTDSEGGDDRLEGGSGDDQFIGGKAWINSSSARCGPGNPGCQDRIFDLEEGVARGRPEWQRPGVRRSHDRQFWGLGHHHVFRWADRSRWLWRARALGTAHPG